MYQKPDYLDQLIDLASAAAGSDYKLAKLIESPRSAISMWRAGVRTCPVADQALMAAVAGLDPQAWADRAIVAQYAGTSKGDKLYKALGKALAATGAAIASSGANAHATYSLTPIADAVNHFIRCIKRLSKQQTTAYTL